MKRLVMFLLVLSTIVVGWSNPGTPLYNSGGQPVLLAADTAGVVRWLMVDPSGQLMVGGILSTQPTPLSVAIDTLYLSVFVETVVFTNTARILCLQNVHATQDLYFSFDGIMYATLFAKSGFSLSGLALDTLYLKASGAGTLAEIITQY